MTLKLLEDDVIKLKVRERNVFECQSSMYYFLDIHGWVHSKYVSVNLGKGQYDDIVANGSVLLGVLHES